MDHLFLFHSNVKERERELLLQNLEPIFEIKMLALQKKYDSCCKISNESTNLTLHPRRLYHNHSSDLTRSFLNLNTLDYLFQRFSQAGYLQLARALLVQHRVRISSISTWGCEAGLVFCSSDHGQCCQKYWHSSDPSCIFCLSS